MEQEHFFSRINGWNRIHDLKCRECSTRCKRQDSGSEQHSPEYPACRLSHGTQRRGVLQGWIAEDSVVTTYERPHCYLAYCIHFQPYAFSVFRIRSQSADRCILRLSGMVERIIMDGCYCSRYKQFYGYRRPRYKQTIRL